MYFPYLRGRQYELIALRELVERKILSKKIIPVVEPVKLSSTLVKTIEVFGAEQRQVALIMNPVVGSFYNEAHEEKNKKLLKDYTNALRDNSYILYMNLLQKDEDPSDFIDVYADNMGTICTDKDAIPVYQNYFEQYDVKYNFVPDESGFRRRIRKNRVLLEDKFNKQRRNDDYIGVDDESFSEDHLYYSEDGYVGFSDYSIVGEEYNETGFAPFAVAIHIVYFADDESLRIKHFVSDTNDDIRDPAGKFGQAVSKLVKWNRNQKLNTIAINEFEDLYQRGAYPGLGTVKKLSIMHHLEEMGKFLDAR